MAQGLISDAEPACFEPLIAAIRQLNRREPVDHRRVLDGAFRIARTGAPWRGLPMRVDVTPGQISDCRGYDAVTDDDLPRPKVLIAAVISVTFQSSLTRLTGPGQKKASTAAVDRPFDPGDKCNGSYRLDRAYDQHF